MIFNDFLKKSRIISNADRRVVAPSGALHRCGESPRSGRCARVDVARCEVGAVSGAQRLVDVRTTRWKTPPG